MTKIYGVDVKEDLMAVRNLERASLLSRYDVNMGVHGDQAVVTAEFLCSPDDIPYLVPGESVNGMFMKDPITRCQYCGQWAARKTACVHCGGAVE